MKDLLQLSDDELIAPRQFFGVGAEQNNTHIDNSSADSEDWPEPIPFEAAVKLPSFPVEVLPPALSKYAIEVAKSRQLPVDVPAVLALAVVAASGARRFIVQVGATHTEPLNLFTAIAMEPGERKSGAFENMVDVIEEYERRLSIEIAPKIKEAEQQWAVDDARLKHLRQQAAKIDEPEKRKQLTKAAEDLAQSMKLVPAYPRLFADDVTPEKLANLLCEQGGRMAVFSAEGGIFDIIAGRYSRDGSANLDVYLKGHAGDTLRVDRINREPDYVHHPALTICLTVQPAVIRSLADKPSFKGRGLLGRFLYSLPESLVGTRKYRNYSLNQETHHAYKATILAILKISSTSNNSDDLDDSHILRIEGRALDLWAEYHDAVETAQLAGGELYSIRDWASKLPGAVARIAGGLHLVEHCHEEPRIFPISEEIVLAAWAIGV